MFCNTFWVRPFPWKKILHFVILCWLEFIFQFFMLLHCFLILKKSVETKKTKNWYLWTFFFRKTFEIIQNWHTKFSQNLFLTSTCALVKVIYQCLRWLIWVLIPWYFYRRGEKNVVPNPPPPKKKKIKSGSLVETSTTKVSDLPFYQGISCYRMIHKSKCINKWYDDILFFRSFVLQERKHWGLERFSQKKNTTYILSFFRILY